ncbi:MAG: hypothetical protein OEY14_14845, partial [Myxococcales bacterium]|nr:hypothetical protein [Myxococcales bacterium]
MGKRGPAEIEEALARGHHVALIGTGSLDAASLGDLTIVRISAAGADATLGPLAAARRELQRLLGRDRPEAAGARPHLGSPRRGLEWPSIAEAALVEVGNALIDRTAGRAALMLDHAESIDEATAASLLDILSRPGWLRLPLVLSFEAARGAHLGALLSRLRGLEGVQVLELEGAKAAASDLASLPNEARGRVLRVLRAAAIVGIPFEISSVAFLLDAEPVSVLEALQEAADAGFPIADGGDGRFVLPQEAAQALRARLLPSLGAFWHRRLAVLHGQLEAGPARRGGASGGAAARAPAPSRAPAAGPDAIGAPLPAPARARTSASATGERQEITPPAYPELFDRREELGSEPSPALPILQPSIASPGARAGAPPASQPPGSRLDADPEAAELPRVSPPPSKDSPAEKARIGPGERPDPARAAAHHAAAGELGRAIDQFLVAAEAAELARDARRA